MHTHEVDDIAINNLDGHWDFVCSCKHCDQQLTRDDMKPYRPWPSAGSPKTELQMYDEVHQIWLDGMFARHNKEAKP